MTIREKVVQVLDSEAFDRFDNSARVNLTIAAFLEAAAEDGWRMRPDEATEEMGKQCAAPQERLPWPENQYKRTKLLYHAMLTAAPPFEWNDQ